MKKLITILLIIVMSFSLMSCTFVDINGKYKVAMISDNGRIDDASFNQANYEACSEFCKKNGIEFSYFSPKNNSIEERVRMLKMASDQGFNVIVMAGYYFGSAVAKIADSYPNTMFIALDVNKNDLGEYRIKNNLLCVTYNEEISGFLAGYAVAKLGYRNIGFLGGQNLPAVRKYGYGYLQGIEMAAEEENINDIVVRYGYSGIFEESPKIVEDMKKWYRDYKVEVVFSCGGNIYNSVAQASATYKGKMVGVDMDQSESINEYYENMTVTSAVKGIKPTINMLLDEIINNDNWSEFGGRVIELGLVSPDNPELNYVQIPYDTTQWNNNFTKQDYRKLIKNIYEGKIIISNDIKNFPTLNHIKVISYKDNL